MNRRSDTIVWMKRFKRWLFFLPVLLILGGCTEPATAPKEDGLEGLTLGQLRPPQQPPWEIKSVISVYVYEVPADRAGQMPEQLDMLDRRAVAYSDRKGFEANHLWAAKGDRTQMAEVNERLVGLGGRFIGRNSYLIMEQDEEVFARFPVAYGQTLSFYRAEGSLIGRTVSSGKMVWVLRWQEIGGEGGAMIFSAIPSFESTLGRQMKKIGRPGSPEDFTVEEAGFRTVLREGEFAALTVSADQRETNSLHWFFYDPALRREHTLVYLIFYADAGAE